MKIKKEPETMAFAFEEVDLEEVKNLGLAGGGKYAGLKQHLLESLPKLSPGKTLAFGLPDKRELTKGQVTSLQQGLNKTLRKAGLDWFVTYSSSRKLFICLPMEGKGSANEPVQIDSAKEDIAKIKELKAQGLSNMKISQQVGMPIHRIRYLMYQRFREIDPASPEPSVLQKLIDQAQNIFKIQDHTKLHKWLRAKFRRAVILVGVKDLGLPRIALAQALDCSIDNVYLTLKNEKDFTGPEVTALRTAMKKEPS